MSCDINQYVVYFARDLTMRIQCGKELLLPGGTSARIPHFPIKRIRGIGAEERIVIEPVHFKH